MSGGTELETLTSESLGARLRGLRQQTGVTLRELAGRLGISPSAVSQIERGVLRPSVSRLIAYVSALGVPLSAVFEAEPEKNPARFAVGRAWEVAPLELGGGVTFRRLAPVPTPGLEFFESVYPPGASSNMHGERLRHEGYEVGTVTAGELTIDFDSDVVTLAAGDSITYPCDRAHLISNRSASVVAVATWIIVNR